MVSPNDVALLKSLLVSQQFEALKRFAQEIIIQENKNLLLKDNEFQFLRDALLREGKNEGLMLLFSELNNVSDYAERH